VLKIDLLPRHFAVARRNKSLIVLMVLLIIPTIVVMTSWTHKLNKQKAAIEAKIAEVQPDADKATELNNQANAERSRIQPILDKIAFIEAADKCGGQFFDRFYAINQFISNKAQVSSFTITPTTVSFTATVQSWDDLKRFLLNLMRCPHITNISYSGPGVSGGAIVGTATAAAAAGPGPGAGMPGPPGGPGMMPGGPAMGPPGGGPGAPAMPGMMPGGPGGPGPGAPGMPPGGAGPAAAAAAPGAAAAGPIDITISATLVEPINVPTPPSAAPAAPAGGVTMAGAAGGMGMGPGMMGPGMMGPGMGPGMGMPPGPGMGPGMGAGPGTAAGNETGASAEGEE